MDCTHFRGDVKTGKLHDFYEPLVILRVLKRSDVGRKARLDNLDRGSQAVQVGIAKFLDRLSWMCDCELGGDTVCAIAMESTSSGTKFWLAAGYKYINKLHTRLRYLLESLELVHTLTVEEASQLQQKICNESIFAARTKVKNYARYVCRLLEAVCEDDSASDQLLWLDLKRMAALAEFTIELCSEADRFRDSESLRLLSGKVNAPQARREWSLLRHYIGRLGSWHRASRTLVEFARAQPHTFKRFEVGSIHTPKDVLAPRADDETNLQRILQRMFPTEPMEKLTRAIEMLQRLHRTDIYGRVYEEYTNKNFKPRVHAETYLLEHFFLKGLGFVGGYRYIGCSKPSCYCCDLYFQFHPGNFVRRDSHGNVWMNWQPPLQSVGDGQKHTAPILTAMIEKMRRDVMNEMISPSAYCAKLPDSTTGFTPSRILRGMEQ